MIVNVRGTSGSGKTYLVRGVLERCVSRAPAFAQYSKRKPVGYICETRRGSKLFVVGSYENACGGCDALPSYDVAFDQVRKAHGLGMDVLFEGLLVSAEVTRTVKLKEDGLPLLVIGLTEVPLEACLSSVAARRLARGETRLLDPTNTESKWKGTRRACDRLEAAGLRVMRCGREEALAAVVAELRL